MVTSMLIFSGIRPLKIHAIVNIIMVLNQAGILCIRAVAVDNPVKQMIRRS